MSLVNKDLLLYSKKILLQYISDHEGEDGEVGRIVNAIKIITPILNNIDKEVE